MISDEIDHHGLLVKGCICSRIFGKRLPIDMANTTISMNKIRQILKLYQQGRSKQSIAILDDFAIQPFDAPSRAALMEIIEDRHGKTSMIITSQLPVSAWYEVIGDKTIADAILDRIVHDAHRMELNGESMRRQRSTSNENNIKTQTL